MAIDFTCNCGKRFSIPDELAGKKGRCPGCGEVIEVPALAEDADGFGAPASPRRRPSTRFRTRRGGTGRSVRRKTGARTRSSRREAYYDDEEEERPRYGGQRRSNTPIFIAVGGLLLVGVIVLIVVAAGRKTAHDPHLQKKVEDFLYGYSRGSVGDIISMVDRSATTDKPEENARLLENVMGAPPGGDFEYEEMHLSESGRTADVIVKTPGGSVTLRWVNRDGRWILKPR